MGMARRAGPRGASAALALALAACASGDDERERAAPTAAALQETAHEEASAPPEREELSVLDPRATRVDGRLAVAFDLANRRGEPRELSWRVAWYDRSGAALETEAWRELRLAPGERRPFELRAASPSASSWRLEFGPPSTAPRAEPVTNRD